MRKILVGLALVLTLIVGESSTSAVQANPAAPTSTEVESSTSAAKVAASTPAGYFYLPQYTWYRVRISPYCYIDYMHGTFGNNSFVQGRLSSLAGSASGNGGCLASSAIRIETWGWASAWCSWGDELWNPPGLWYCSFDYATGTLQITAYGLPGLLGGNLRYMANILPFDAYYINFSPIS